MWGWIAAAVWFTACAGVQAQDGDEIRVVVTAPREVTSLPALGREMITIRVAELPLAPSATVADVLRGHAGVEVREFGTLAGAAALAIRGGSGDQVLVLLNGQRLNTAQGSGVDLHDLPLADVERIELLRGPAATRYGADAVTGVLNIVTRSGMERLGEWRAAGGSFGQAAGSFRYGGVAGVADFLVAASHTREEGDFSFTDPFGNRLVRQNSDYQGHTESLTVGTYPTPISRISLYLEQYEADKGVPGTVQFPSPSARQHDRRQVATVGWQRNPGPRAGLSVTGSIVEQRRRYKDPGGIGNPDEKFENHTHSVRAEASQLRWGKGQGAYGIEWRQETLRSTAVGDRQALVSAGYGEMVVKSGPASVSLSARGERHSVFGTQAIWGVGAERRSSSRRVLRAFAGTAYRVPGFDDLYWPDETFAVGNPNLRPERSSHLELGSSFPVGGADCDIALYRYRVRDLINWRPDAAGKWSPINVGTALLSGAEAQASVPLGGTRLELRYTLQSAKDASLGSANRGRQLIGRPKQQASFTLTSPRGSWDWSLLGRYVGVRFTTADNSGSLPGYFVVDARAGFKLPGSGKVGIRVGNLFNREYQDKPGYPMPGRSLGVEVSRAF